jgi:hypothetical protein
MPTIFPIHFLFVLLLIIYFLTIIANMFQMFNFAYVECCINIDNEGIKGPPKKKKITKDVSDDELVLTTSRVVLEVNEKGETVIKL